VYVVSVEDAPVRVERRLRDQSGGLFTLRQELNHSNSSVYQLSLNHNSNLDKKKQSTLIKKNVNPTLKNKWSIGKTDYNG
jgi:hypothetical protein